MQRHTLSTIAATIAAAALLAGCSTSAPQAASEDPKVAAQPDKVASPTPQDAPPMAPAPTAQAAAPAPALENSESETSAPFILTLSGPATLPDTGEIEITARITAPHEFKVPATLSVALPKGASLSAGKDAESMASIPGGGTTRIFKVKLSGKLDQPIRITLDAKDPAGTAGAHAERTFPADLKPKAARPSSAVPPPPVGRPGAASPKR
jgi:outer membrane murein-binding lipoprotein Lpp